MYDVIVIGARCAGSPTAMQLARRGHKVLALDRDTFPSDVVSTHCLTGDAVPRLTAWGLMDEVLATGLKPLHTMTLRAFGMVIENPMPDGLFGLNPRRYVLDNILANAARKAGAEIREAVSVQELIMEGDTVVGVRARSGDTTFEERAKVVVGADGKGSVVAKTVKPEEYNVHPGTTAGYYSYWSGVPHTGNELMIMPGFAGFVFPTNDDMVCLGIEFTAADHFEEWRKDPESKMLEKYDEFGIGERVRAGKREEKILGIRWPGDYYRKPYGPGWALVGDAGFLKDPILGQGINDAFRDADLLSDALDAGLTGRVPMEEALAGYQAERDATSFPMFTLNHEMSKLMATPEILMQFAAGPPQPAATPA